MTTNKEDNSALDERLEKITILLEQTSKIASSNSEAIKELREESKQYREESKQFREEIKEQSIKFAAYQQATQWVVNLAFSLIASATIITVASAIFKR